MKRSFFSLILLCFLGSDFLFAQKPINIKDVQIVNLGDGQQYIHERGDSKKVIDGKIRLITGVTTEYSEGMVKDGYFDGSWNNYKKNNLQQTANFKDGYLDGKQYYYFPNGNPEYEATFKKGIKEGDWLYYNRKGGKREQITYANNKMTRKRTFYINGNVDMERNFKDGKEHGVSKTFTQEGEMKSEKNYVEGKQVGKQVMFMNSNIGNFIRHSNYNEKGNLDGAYSEDWAEINKPKVKGQYVNGEKDGKWIEYSNDGTQTIRNYKDGVTQK